MKYTPKEMEEIIQNKGIVIGENTVVNYEELVRLLSEYGMSNDAGKITHTIFENQKKYNKMKAERITLDGLDATNPSVVDDLIWLVRKFAQDIVELKTKVYYLEKGNANK